MQGTAGGDLIVEDSGAVRRITINRPERRNALTDEVMSGMTAAFASAPSAGIDVIVLTGAGDRAFCGGADLKPGETPFRPNVEEPSTPFMNLLRAANAVRMPVIGRINGHCVAGGMGLLACCDMAIAVDNATFALPEVKIGIFPMQVMLKLRDLVPERRLAELCFSSERIDARTALEWGLLNAVVPAAELDARTDAMVARVLANSPLAIRRGKYAMNAIRGMGFEAAAAFLESQIPPMIMTDDAREGLASFNEKRPPRWSGRDGEGSGR